jgi:tight adherence protein B
VFVMFWMLFCLTTSIVLFLTRTKPHEKRIQQRIDMLIASQGSTSEADVEIGLTKQFSDTFSGRISQRVRSYAAGQRLEKKLQQAGWDISVGKFLIIAASSSIGAALVGHLLVNWTLMAALALLAGAAGNFGMLHWKCSRRLHKFNEGLPDSIELMSRALRAGHSMSSALEVVAQQSPEPIGSEFARCAQQQRFGIPFRDALQSLNDRVPSQDLHFLVTAILVQKETGGDLTEILDRTTEVIRERVRIQGEVRTRTAQGRLTGWILSGLPVVLLGVISLTSPSYSQVLFYDPLGQKLLYTAGGLIVIGAFVIRRIVDIKV